MPGLRELHAAQPEVIARLPTGACQGTILEPKMSSARRLSTATPQDGGPISGAARERARAPLAAPSFSALMFTPCYFGGDKAGQARIARPRALGHGMRSI